MSAALSALFSEQFGELYAGWSGDTKETRIKEVLEEAIAQLREVSRSQEKTMCQNVTLIAVGMSKPNEAILEKLVTAVAVKYRDQVEDVKSLTQFVDLLENGAPGHRGALIDLPAKLRFTSLTSYEEAKEVIGFFARIHTVGWILGSEETLEMLDGVRRDYLVPLYELCPKIEEVERAFSYPLQVDALSYSEVEPFFELGVTLPLRRVNFKVGSNDALANLEYCPYIKTLHMKGCGALDELGFEILPRLPHLQTLICPPGMVLSERMAHLLEGCKKLSTLYIMEGTKVSREVAEILGRIPMMSNLFIREEVTDDALVKVQRRGRSVSCAARI